MTHTETLITDTHTNTDINPNQTHIHTHTNPNDTYTHTLMTHTDTDTLSQPHFRPSQPPLTLLYVMNVICYRNNS